MYTHMKPIISLKNIEKDFLVPKKTKEGFWHSVKSIFYREWQRTTILKNLSLDINEGEFVGYIGPNGAGKSTTIKILTGVLTPSKGTVEVCGFVPHKDRYRYAYNIGVVFGHRSLLEFDIPVIESFLLYKSIYELTDRAFNERMKFFSRILKIDELLHIPVRKLSLGQRMRCEIAASLLHKPKVVFLDEPTIGLDALAKEEIRDFLLKINKIEKTTIILTTHDMDDIEALCRRIIVLDDGKVIYDGTIEQLKDKYLRHKTLEFEAEKIKDAPAFKALLSKLQIMTHKGNHYSLRVDIREHDLQEILNKLLSCCEVNDLLVHEPKLEHIIQEIYSKGEA